MKPEQNGWYFADDIFKYILLDFFYYSSKSHAQLE